MCMKSLIVSHTEDSELMLKGAEDDESTNDEIKIDVEDVGDEMDPVLGLYETESERIKSQSLLLNGLMHDEDDEDADEPEPMIATLLSNDNHHHNDQQTPSAISNKNQRIPAKKCEELNGRSTNNSKSLNGTSGNKNCKYNSITTIREEKKLKEVVEKIKNKFNSNPTPSPPPQLSQFDNNLPKLTNGHSLSYQNHSNGTHEVKTKLPRKRSINSESAIAVPAPTPAFEPSSSKAKATKFLKLYDADKHCGVSVMGSKPCTRSLTCKKHSIALRRQVEGRSRPFNELFKQYRDEKMHQSASLGCAELNQTINHANLVPSSSELMKPPPDVNFINSSVNSSRWSVEPMMGGGGAKMHESKVSAGSLLGDGTEQVVNEGAAFSKDGCYMSSHPRPLAVCSFGARMMPNSGMALWNRKEDHFRAVLNRTFEVYSHRKNALNMIAQQKQQQQIVMNHVHAQYQPQTQTHSYHPQQVINIPQPQLVQQQQPQQQQLAPQQQQQQSQQTVSAKRMPTSVNRAGVVNRLFKNRIIVSK